MRVEAKIRGGKDKEGWASGTVGWARTTDLLFHRKNIITDRATQEPPKLRKYQ